MSNRNNISLYISLLGYYILKDSGSYLFSPINYSMIGPQFYEKLIGYDATDEHRTQRLERLLNDKV